MENLNTDNLLPDLPTEEEIKAAMYTPDFLPDDEWWDADITNSMLDVTEPYEAPKYTLSWDGVKFAPLGGLHVITGQSGNGKTFTFTQMIVAILKGNFGGLKFELTDVQPSVLYIDTEQEKENTKLVNLRVYSMMGWEFGIVHDEFKIMCLREEEKAIYRWRKVIKAIDTYRPTVCFLDGMLDVIADFNDNKECSEMVYKNMKIASHYGMSMWVLVHENPGSTKMVGHLGSILQRKVTDELSSVKDKNEETGEATFTIKQKKNRGKDMKAWKFRVIDGRFNFGEPEIIDSPAASPSLYDKFKAFMPAGGYNTRDMRSKVVEKFLISESEATKMIKQAVADDILKATQGKNNSIIYTLKLKLENNDSTMPF